MKQIIAVVVFIFVVTGISFAQADKGLMDAKLPVSPSHYLEEYTNDVSSDPAAWQGLKKGLHVSFATTDELYFRSEVPAINETLSWAVVAWKGERVNTQILVWSADTIGQIRVTLHPLKNEKGAVLSRENIRANKIAYVLSNYPYDARDASCGGNSSDKVYLLPDRFDPLEQGSTDRFDLPGKTVRPIWISIDIPANAQPGLYKGIVEVQGSNGQAMLNLELKVQNRVLPKPHDWKFRLDLWQNPWVIAEYYHVRPWSEAHKALLKTHMKLYADAGGKFITTYGVHSPWGDNEYSLEKGMIEWIRLKNGSWKFDYTIFDQYVKLAMGLGIDKAITIYTPVPWGERFRYMDEKTGNYVYERWQPTSDTFSRNWNAFLTDLRIHLDKKGWFNKTYLGVNENAMEQTLSVIKVIKAHPAHWRITYAGDWHTELDGLLDDYCSVYGKEPDVAEVDKRSAVSRTTTFYICCTPPKPNTFVFSPPVEGRWLGWYAFAHHYDGFLRWAYDAWPGDPMRDARYGSWAAGDCYMVYPGGNSSIRFEKLREGIADYEKLRILKQKARTGQGSEVKQLLAELDKQVDIFNGEKDFKKEKIGADLDKGRKLVEELSDKIK